MWLRLRCDCFIRVHNLCSPKWRTWNWYSIQWVIRPFYLFSAGIKLITSTVLKWFSWTSCIIVNWLRIAFNDLFEFLIQTLIVQHHLYKVITFKLSTCITWGSLLYITWWKVQRLRRRDVSRQHTEIQMDVYRCWSNSWNTKDHQQRVVWKGDRKYFRMHVSNMTRIKINLKFLSLEKR